MKENIKKYVFPILGVVVLVALIFGAKFYYQNLRGVGPVVKGPSGNIAEEIETANNLPAKNETQFPLQIPAGFNLSIYAKDIIGSRVIAFDPVGNMLVSQTSVGNVAVLSDANDDGKADKIDVLLSQLNKPHGLAFKCDNATCKLYVAETNQVATYDYDVKNLKAVNKQKIIDLPSGSGHFTRTISFGPDGRLYVSIGSSCNVCNESDNRRAKIFSSNADGSDFKEFASGLRNTVFFTWDKAGKMWGTDMGRDLLGDNTPPEDINIIEAGKNYGWPFCYGNKIHDTNFDKNQYLRDPCADTVAPKVEMQAHSAPLGLAFVPSPPAGGWPKEYQNSLLVSFHGSWNRSVPTGYSIVRIVFDESGNYKSTEPFISGWLSGKSALGRPVDIVMQKGSAYISDDKAGVIYKLTPISK